MRRRCFLAFRFFFSFFGLSKVVGKYRGPFGKSSPTLCHLLETGENVTIAFDPNPGNPDKRERGPNNDVCQPPRACFGSNPPARLRRLLRLHPLRHTPFPPRGPLILLLDGLALRPHLPPPATAGRAHHDPLAPVHRRRVLAPEIDPPVLPLLSIPAPSPLLHPPHPVIDAARGFLPAGEPVRVIDAPFAQDAHLHGDAEFDVPDHALPAAVLARARAARAQPERAQDDRVAALEDLGVRDAGVGHVGVDAVGAGPGRAGAGAAGDGLVVAEALCGGGGGGEVAAEAEGQVVAVALGGGAGGEGEEDDVGDALRGEDVAAHDGGFVRGGEEGFRGDEYLDGLEAALVQGDVVGDEAAETVDYGGVGDGFGGVGVAVDFGAGAGEVEDCFALFGVDGDFEFDGASVVHVVGGC